MVVLIIFFFILFARFILACSFLVAGVAVVVVGCFCCGLSPEWLSCALVSDGGGCYYTVKDEMEGEEEAG
jgi:hypothetical protein